MISGRGWLRVVLMAGLVAASIPSPSRALDAIDFNVGAGAANEAPRDRTAASDEDEDAFFSSGAKIRERTGTVATIGALPRSAAQPRPTVDVVATCRAVLADNLNYYNHNFIEGCQRVTARGASR